MLPVRLTRIVILFLLLKLRHVSKGYKTVATLDNDTSLLDKNREPIDSSFTDDLVPTTKQVGDDTSCQHIPKTITNKCEDDSCEIYSIGDSTSSSVSLLVSLNSNDTPDSKRDNLLHNRSAETVSGLPNENLIPINDDKSIANSV